MIAITGASGFIGHSLIAAARDAKLEVRALSRSQGLSGYEDADELTRAFAGCDAVVHLAARAHRGGSDADFACNVRSARAVAAGARAAGVRRVVLLSSKGVNGNTTQGKPPFTEAYAPAPTESYARSKLQGEREIQTSGVEWVVIRPPLVYGPNAPGNFARLVRAVARGWPLPFGAVQNKRSLVGVANLCDFIIACVSHPAAANELFVVADGDDLSTPEIVRCIARGLDKPAKLWNVAPGLVRAAAQLAGRGRIAQSLCDSLQVDAAKARDLLGWRPRVRTSSGIESAAREWTIAP